MYRFVFGYHYQINCKVNSRYAKYSLSLTLWSACRQQAGKSSFKSSCSRALRPCEPKHRADPLRLEGSGTGAQHWRDGTAGRAAGSGLDGKLPWTGSGPQDTLYQVFYFKLVSSFHCSMMVVSRNQRDRTRTGQSTSHWLMSGTEASVPPQSAAQSNFT